MSYEYKELIEQAIIDDDRPLDWEEGFKELDEVYAKAAKADEYEDKAKAFDAIMREWEDERMTKSHILETIQKYYDEYESGESNAKK